MAAIRPTPYCINGHWWRDVTDETTAGMVYNTRDVIACNGQVPWIISSDSHNTQPKPKNPAIYKPHRRFPVPPKHIR